MAARGELGAREPLHSDQVPGNLPEPVSELIGRDDVLSEILNLAAANRLVTLTGGGGKGKTRLALTAARELMSDFADGVWLVELSPVADPVLVPATVAAAIGVEIGPGKVSAQRVAVMLSDRQLLVVLDTCEHMIAAAATVAEALLHAGRAVRVLATSRESSQAEWIYPVPPLAVPSEDVAIQDELLRYGAVQLFVQRARAANPRFVPDPGNVAKIAATCRRIDGIPLAIEMAAARASTLRTDEIAARLDNRFQFLIGGGERLIFAIRRYVTLDWSYELLSEHERVILRRLGIFAGPFTLDAVSSIAASPPDVEPWQVIEGVSILVARSLVVGEFDGASSRFRLLDTTRAYIGQRFPRIEIEMLESSRARLLTALRNAVVDIAIVPRATSLPETNTMSLWSERIMVAVQESHTLAAKEAIYWIDLRDEKLLLGRRDPGPELQDLLVARLASPGDRPNIVDHDVSCGSLISLGGAGSGLTLLTEPSAGANIAGVIYRECVIAPSSPDLAIPPIGELTTKTQPCRVSSAFWGSATPCRPSAFDSSAASSRTPGRSP